MILLFLDTETTGFKCNRLVQLAWDHHPTGLTCNELFLPPEPIEEEATAVHGITQEMVQDKSSFRESKQWEDLREFALSTTFVCHNAEYDLRVLKNEGLHPRFHICTMKVARKLLPAEPDHKLQGLYQRIKFDIPGQDAKAHDAMGDVTVMIGLFAHLFKIQKSKGWPDSEVIKYFEEISMALPEVMPFGKFKGVAFADLPEDYVAWMMTKSTDWSKDILEAIYKAFPQYAAVPA